MFKRHKSFCGGMKSIEDDDRSDRTFSINWHNIADCIKKGAVWFEEMLMV